MNIELKRETSIYADGALKLNCKIFLALCPECGYTKAKHARRQLYTNGIMHEGASVTIDCPVCLYHEWIFVGPDI